MLATVANGGLYMSSNFGSTWSQVSAALLQATWSLLDVSSTGQYISVYSPPVTVTPQFAGITPGVTGTWSVNNVTWSVSASTYVNTSYYPTYMFNNAASSWASGSGAYTPSYPSSGTNTLILGVGTIYGDWLQLQSSTPLTMNSYTFMSGGTVTQMPKIYYIVGSNDGTNWYPIQYVSGTTNAATAVNQVFTTYFNVLYTGTQSVTSGQVGSYATTSYATSGNAYTYFRIITTTLWASVSNVEIGEWYINFTAGGQLYSTNFGSSWGNLLPASTSTLATSGSGQYSLENINTTTVTTTPQLTGLATSTWNVSGVVWTATANSNLGANFLPQYAFNNYYGLTAPYSWCSANSLYSSSSGAYTAGAVSTTILASGSYVGGSYQGEYLQLQSSVPLIMYSYAIGCSSAQANAPKNYFIVGSNDGTNWYPIQNVIGVTIPFSGSSQIYNPYMTVNYTGTQLITGGQSGQFTTTSYPSSTNAYTYFRIIANSVWASNGGNYEIGEWYINFNNVFTQPQLTGLTGDTSSSTLVPTTWTSNNVTWVSTASSIYGAGTQPCRAFDNVAPPVGGTQWLYQWSSINSVYRNSDGAYTGLVTTTIGAPYSASYIGEWLQIQSSVPLAMYSYSFAFGLWPNTPKTYFIVGSNDGSSWFPIQLVSFSANPSATANSVTSTTYLLAGYTGTQTYNTTATTVNASTTSYSTSSNSYTYFRIIIGSTYSLTTSYMSADIMEWIINFTNKLTSPQLTGLSGDTTTSTPVATSWTANNSNIRWTSSASSIYSASTQSWIAFKNAIASGIAWVSASSLYPSATYNGLVSTTISAPYSVAYAGEYLQIQSSVPVVLYNYTFATGNNSNNIPKNYLIAGSNDGITWYPIQLASMASNPFSAISTSATSYLLANSSSIQTLNVGGSSASVTTTAYSTSGNSYTYFRIIANTLNTSGGNFELGQWYVNFTTTTVSPQLTGLTGSTSGNIATTWTANNSNITWTSSASSVASTVYQAWIAFNNIAPTSSAGGNYSFASAGNYNNSTGVYNNTYSTTIAAPYSATYAGEWLQIQSSVPVVMYNYSFAIADTSNSPKTYLIAGSNDGSTWYPIQLVNMGATNAFVNWARATTYLLANYTGTQSFTASNTISVTTTSYSTSSNAYTYFRIITNTTFGGTYTNFELTEWYINFTPTQYVTSNYLSATSSTPYTAPVFSPALTSTNVPITSAASQTGQYMVLITNNASGANVYYSTNYGANFTGLTIGTSTMVSCAISSDGSYITVMNATTVYQLNNNSIGFSVAVGNQAGLQNQAQNAIAIGSYAGQQNQTANSIVLNATGAALNSYVPGFYVAPIQQYGASSSSSFNLLGYGSDNQVVQASVISLLPSGNVGIGTTNPTAALHVIGNINTSGNIIATNFASTDFIIGNIGTAYVAGKWLTLNLSYVNGSYPTSGNSITNSLSIGANFTNGSSEVDFMNNVGTGFNFYARTAASTASLLMSMLYNGNVGIGAAVPYSKLDINSSSSSMFGLSIACPGEAYGFGSSAKNTYTTAGTLVSIGTFNAVASAGALIDYSMVGTGGNTNVYAGGIAGSTSGGPGIFVIGRRTAVTTWAESMRIDTSGNVGIGTASPAAPLHVYGAGTSASYTSYQFSIGSSGPRNMIFGVDGNSGSIQSVYNGTSSAWLTLNPIGGNVGIGTNSPSSAPLVVYNTSAALVSQHIRHFVNSNWAIWIEFGNAGYTAAGNFMLFQDPTGNTRGTITSNGQNTITYGVGSDRRIKNNINDIDNIRLKIQCLRPRRFKLNGIQPRDEEHYGFIAQEVQDYYPYLVSGEESETNILQLDYGKFSPFAIAGCKDLYIITDSIIAKNNQLEATIQQQAAEITTLQSTIAQNIQAQVNAQQIQIAELMQRLEKAGIA